MRIFALDGLRGLFLIGMTIVHVNGPIRSQIARHNHHDLGWADTAQGFVFLSGLVVGMVFGTTLLKTGIGLTLRKTAWRMASIYKYQFALMLIITAFVLIDYQRAMDVDPRWGTAPLIYLSLSLATLAGPIVLDILPMYLTFMLITPLALLAFSKNRYGLVLTISCLVWILAQTGLADLVLRALADVLGLEGTGIRLGLYFNRLGWQILYVFGLAIGMKLAQGRFDPSIFLSRAGHALFLASVVLFALFALTNINDGFSELVGYRAFLDANPSLYEKSSLAPLVLINFAVDAYLVAWLLVAGASRRGTRALSAVTNRIVTWKPFVVLGKHSLQVYSFHVLCFYVLWFFIAEHMQGLNEVGRFLAVLAFVLVLYVPACAHEFARQRR